MNIRITGSMTAAVRKLEIKANKSNDGREAAVDLEIGVDHEDSPKSWGENFTELAFSSMRKRTVGVGDQAKEVIEHLQDKITPSDKCTCELHRLAIGDEVLELQPELVSITTVDGVARVVAKLRLPIPIGKTALIDAFGEKVGDDLDLVFNPKQGSLFDVTKARKGKGKKAAAETDAETAPAAE